MDTVAGDLTPWGEEIQRHLDRLGWSRNELGRRAGVDSGNLSKMMRGVLPVSHKTADAIAGALQVDAIHLKRIAGLWVAPLPSERDSRIEYIAQRIAELPLDLQEEAIEALGTQLDVIYRVAGVKRGKSDDEAFEREMAELDERLPGMQERLHEIKAKQRRQEQQSQE